MLKGLTHNLFYANMLCGGCADGLIELAFVIKQMR